MYIFVLIKVLIIVLYFCIFFRSSFVNYFLLNLRFTKLYLLVLKYLLMKNEKCWQIQLNFKFKSCFYDFSFIYIIQSLKACCIYIFF